MTTPSHAKRWWALALLSLAQFLVILDTSIVGIALPDIQSALGFSGSSLQWVFNAYVIAFGGLLLLGGRLADIVGPRRMLAVGFGLLTSASLLAGVAWTDDVLVVGRGAQGIGAALIAPAAMAVLMRVFTEPRELGRAMSIWGAAAPAGGTAGVFLGGVFTEWADWRWTFLVNVPVGLIVLAAIPAVLPRIAGQRGRIDVAGAGVATAGLSGLVYAIVTANDRGWGSATTVALLAGSAALLALFVGLQRSRRDPLVPLSILRAPNLAAGNLAMALLGASWIPMWFTLNLYLRNVLDLGPFAAGAALLPMTGAIMLLMVGVTGRLLGRVGFKPLLVGGLLLLAGGVALLARVPVDGSFATDVLGATLVAAAGMSLAYVPTLVASLSGVRPEQGGLASGLVSTSYQVGSALGLAVATAIGAAFVEGSTIAELTEGYRAALVASAVLALAGAAVGLVAIRTRLTVAAPADAEASGLVDTAAPLDRAA